MVSLDDFLRLFAYLLYHRDMADYNIPLGKSENGLLGNLDLSDGHTYSLGSTGSGKSYLLLNIIFRLILKGKAGCLVDPYGELFRNLSSLIMLYNYCRVRLPIYKKMALAYLDKIEGSVKWLRKDEINPELYNKILIVKKLLEADLENLFVPLNVQLVDLSRSDNPLRINPFECFPNESISQGVDAFTSAIERYSGQSSNETPRLASILLAVFSLMTVNKMEYGDIISVLKRLGDYCGQGGKSAKPIPKDFFKNLLGCNDKICEQAEFYLRNQLLRLSKPEYLKALDSTMNRLRFVNTNTVANFLDTPKTMLDLYSLINSTNEKKSFLLFYIPIERQGAKFLASYLLNRIESLIFQRTRRQKELIYHLVIDEFFEFSSDEIASNFAKVRQYGLRYIIAHQTIEQLKKEDATGFRLASVFHNCKNRIIFKTGGEGSEMIAKECFPVTGELPHITFSISKGKSTSFGTTEQESFSESNGSAVSNSKTVSNSEQISNSSSRSRGYQHSSGVSSNTGSSSSRGTHYDLENGVMTNLGDGMNISNSTTKSQGRTENKGHSVQSGESQTKGFGKATSDGYTTTTNRIETTGHTKGKSENHSESETFTEHHGHYSLSDEYTFIAQNLKMLMSREFYLCTEGLNAVKLRTLDSLNFRIKKSLDNFLEDNFYLLLWEFQKGKHLKFIEIQKSLELENETKNSLEGDVFAL